MTRIALPKGAKIGGILASRDIQTALKSMGYYTGTIDDHLGAKSIAAAETLLTHTRFQVRAGWSAWPADRLFVGVAQVLCLTKGIDAGPVDGMAGPQTKMALEDYVRHVIEGKPREFFVDTLPPVITPNDDVIPLRRNVWPFEKDLLKFYGPMGQNQTKVDVPWPMFLAWDTKSRVRTITCHEKVASSLERILTRINGHYSNDQIKDMGVHLFGGSLNVRLMRGSKTRWSTHSWGIAIDFDPERNGLKTPFAKARLGQPDAIQFWKFWEEEGWVSLGRSQNRDAMHVQACRP